MSLLPDWLTGYDQANADAAANADAQLHAAAIADYATPGGKYYSAANAAAVAADYASQAPMGVVSQQAAIDTVFTDSLASTAGGIVGTPTGIFWSEVKSLLSAIPWWVWIGAASGVFFWLGGFDWLTRSARGALKK